MGYTRTMDLFTHAQKTSPEGQPLAELLRPARLEDMLGQPKILGDGAPWRRLLQAGQIPSLLLWGPPGCGKTTFALLLAQKVNAEFITINAVETGAKALRELGEAGRRRRLEYRRRSLLFIDEIHRLNKSQQDVLLPFVEKGDLILVGATTENPSYEINSALLSRCRILVFERLEERDLRSLAERACAVRGSTLDSLLTPEALKRLIEFADGDGRRLLNTMEILLNLKTASAVSSQMSAQSSLSSSSSATQSPSIRPSSVQPSSVQLSSVQPSEGQSSAQSPEDDEDEEEDFASNVAEPVWPLDVATFAQLLDAPSLRYDKAADEHYDTISAFIKSVRGSDPDAAVYYLARMIKGGEDPVFIARRLVILASEDIGNADPRALTVAISGLQAVELVGWPEAAISLAQVTTYLSSAPKSNRSYMALKKAQELVESTGTVPIPLSLRSAKTTSMKELGYGKGYGYSHEGEKGYVPQRFLPEELGDVSLYEPTDHGFEKNIRQYLKWLKS